MQIPLTFRLVYHTVRSAIRAALLFFCAWLVFIPATAAEVEALGAQPGTQYPPGLRPMRSARAFVAIAPDRAYSLLATASGQDISPLFVRLIMVEVASGRAAAAAAASTAESPAQNTRDIDGPRFIQVD
ncbi:MAG: hypothetical protein AAFU41_01050 [Pseudomonadota bacterium]